MSTENQKQVRESVRGNPVERITKNIMYNYKIIRKSKSIKNNQKLQFCALKN